MDFIMDITALDFCKISVIVLFFICFVAGIVEFFYKYKTYKEGVADFIIILIIGGVFTYAFEILKIYLIIVLPLTWLAAEIKKVI